VKKACITCLKVKETAEFNWNGYGGRRTNCKACQAKYRSGFVAKPKPEKRKWQLAIEAAYPVFPTHGTRCWCCRMRTGKKAEVALCYVCMGIA